MWIVFAILAGVFKQYYNITSKASAWHYVLSAEVSISAELLVEADAALQDTGAILVEPRAAAARTVARVTAVARRTRHVTRQTPAVRIAVLVVMTMNHTAIGVKVVADVTARACPRVVDAVGTFRRAAAAVVEYRVCHVNKQQAGAWGMWTRIHIMYTAAAIHVHVW